MYISNKKPREVTTTQEATIRSTRGSSYVNDLPQTRMFWCLFVTTRLRECGLRCVIVRGGKQDGKKNSRSHS